MAPLSDHCARSGGEAHTSARGREAAVMRLDSGATDSHMRRQGSSVQGERLPHRTQSVLPLSGCATAASPLRTRYLFSPPTFSVAGKSSEVVKLTSGQALVSSVSEHHSERQGAGSQSRVPGREAGWVQCGIASSSQSLQRNEPRGRRPKYTWRTGRQTPGGAHSQIMARSSPAHKSAGTRRDFTLPPPLPTEGLAYRSSERRVQGADAGLRGRLPAAGGGRGEGETSSAATRVLARAVSHGDLRELALPPLLLGLWDRGCGKK